MTEGGFNAILNIVERTFEQDKNFRRLNSKYAVKSELY
jgi:hypothetical protein